MANFVTGYFRDPLNNIAERLDFGPAATAELELRPISHDFKPTTTTDVVITGPYGPELVRPGIGQKLHHTGGGLVRITVPFHARRYTRGDAEKYLYDMLVHLSRTDLGELCVHGRAYKNCWFVSGDGQIFHARSNNPVSDLAGDTTNRSRFHVSGQLHFVRGSPPSVDLTPPNSMAPPERVEHINGANNGDYKATLVYTNQEVKVGRYCDLASVSVDRSYLAVEIPRCDGVRLIGRGHTQPGIATQLDYRRNRRVSLNFRGLIFSYETNDATSDPVLSSASDEPTNNSRLVLERRIMDLQVKLRGENLKLAGNGNTFVDCYMTRFAPDDDTEAYTSLGFNASFEQDLNEVAAI